MKNNIHNTAYNNIHIPSFKFISNSIKKGGECFNQEKTEGWSKLLGEGNLGRLGMVFNHPSHAYCFHTHGIKDKSYLLSSGLRIFFFLLSCCCDKFIKQRLSIFHFFNCFEPRVFSMLGCKFTKSSSVTKRQVYWFGRAFLAGSSFSSTTT